MAYKVLIVDDDNDTRLLLATMLTEAGYETLTVSTLPTAMQALTDEAPDALIVDVRLDGYNGLQLVAQNPRSIPVVVVTGFADAVLEREARQMGAAYLLKPVLPQTLLTVLHQKLARAGEDTRWTPPRAWTRTLLPAPATVWVDTACARILDVSYGGLRFEIDRTPGAWLPDTFPLTVPSAKAAIPVTIVWKRRSADTCWQCGAVVADAYRSRWQELVNAMTVPPS